MLRRTHKRLYLSPSAAALAEIDGSNRVSVLERADLDAEDASADLVTLLASWGRRKGNLAVSEIIVSDEWCRFFMVKPPVNAAKLRDLQFSAESRFEKLYDDKPDDWAIEADWKVSKPFLACAMYRPALGAIDAANVVRVDHVVPQTIDYLNRHGHKRGNRNAWLIAARTDHAIVTALGLEGVTDVHQLPIAQSMWVDPHALDALVDGECLRFNLPRPADIVLCGDVPESWSPAPVTGARVHVHREAVFA